MKNKGRQDYFKFHKSRDFFIFYDNHALLGVISQCSPPFCTLQKRSSSPLLFGQEENIPRHSIKRRAYWFILKIARMFPIPTRWWTLLMKAFLLLSLWPGTEYTRVLIWKKSLLIYFESYQGISYLFPHRQSIRECEHFANG